mgnify:CR=1 FL=1
MSRPRRQLFRKLMYSEAYRQLEAQLDMGLDNIEPTKNRALVVRAASTKELARAFGVDGQLEGRVLPAVRHASGLHIEVTVNEQGFLEKDRDISIDESQATLKIYLLWVIAQFTEQGRWKIQLLTFENLLSQRTLFDLDTKALQLASEPITHSVNIRSVSGC